MRHYIVTLVLLALITVAHLGLLQMGGEDTIPDDFELDEKIPHRVVDYAWTHDVPVGDWLIGYLGTKHILRSGYRASTGRPVMLTIVYSSSRRSLHLPEGCIKGEGGEIVGQQMLPVGMSFSAKGLLLQDGDLRRTVLYWFKTGDDFTGSFFNNTFHWARNKIRRGPTTSAMIRLSTPVVGNDVEGAFAQMRDFAAKLTPVLKESLP